MAVLLTCKNEKDPIKNKGAIVLTRLYIIFADAQRQLTPQSVFKLIQTFMVVWSAVAWWLMPLTPDSEVGGFEPHSGQTVLCP